MSLHLVDQSMMDMPLDSSLLMASLDAASVLELNPMATYNPSPPLELFHRSFHDRRLVRAGNKLGKTVAGGIESWWHALGTHPYRPVRHKAGRGLIVCTDFQSYVDDVGRILWEWAPRHMIHPRSDYNAERGWKNDMILLRDPDRPDRVGYEIIFRTSSQAQVAVSGVAVDWLWINEPPAKPVFTEALRSVADATGPAWMTFTPIGRPMEWLKLYVEGDPETGKAPVNEWEQFVIELTPENVPHRSKASIMAQIADIPEEEYAQRVKAHWYGTVPDRKLQGFTESCKRASQGYVTLDMKDGWKFSLGMDHGETAGRQYCVLLAWHPQRQVAWAVDEYVSTWRTTEAEDAFEILKMLRRNGLPLRRITDSVGDVNSAGKGGAGESINLRIARYLGAHNAVQEHLLAAGKSLPGSNWKNDRQYAEAVEQMARGTGGIAVSTAEKGPDAMKTGLHYMNTAFGAGGLYIDSTHCPVLTRSVASWQGDSKDEAKHAVDAFRYVLYSILLRFLNPAKYTSSVAARGR